MPKNFYSYKTIPQDAIELEWYVYDIKFPKDGVIKRWKKNMDLNISIRAYVNNNAIMEFISNQSQIAFYICYHSLSKFDGTSLHGVSKKIPYKKSLEPSIDIDINDILIPGTEISGSTEITFYVVLETENTNTSPSIFANEKGSILYENSILLHLEGNHANFPVKAIDFNTIDEAKGKNALYYLKKKYTQLDSNFNTAYTLFFNTRHELFSKINSDNENDLAASYLIKMIMYDVYKTIIQDALDPDTGLNEITEQSDDLYSLQAVYSRIINDLIYSYFPGKKLDDMKSLLITDESSRNALYTAIQDYIIGE